MGSQDGDSDAEASATVSMEDFKKLETTVISSIEAQKAQMDALREMIAQLIPAKIASTSPSLEDPKTPPRDPASVSPEEEKVGDETISDSNPTKKNDGKKGYHNVDHKYSPDPIIPHPHIKQ